MLCVFEPTTCTSQIEESLATAKELNLRLLHKHRIVV